MLTNSFLYKKEYWNGNSKDGIIVNGDGLHYFKMDEKGNIFEAYEVYDSDEGDEIVTSLPEMQNINWLKDLGFQDFELLYNIKENEFIRTLNLW